MICRAQRLIKRCNNIPSGTLSQFGSKRGYNGRELYIAEAVTAPKVIVESDDVSIGAEGGKPVARVDDLVDLSTGKIISGSEKVTAA
ncbi:hypothetical protein [uncultured Novosphingobium sp.]|uniref:hypothetical protein n=1 Tax=uncultured Novosphingobium sp. TaxID=292277 RepID=UPI00259A9059|nr:hypothetical protein [uncultured Novosphingobium sp.]